MADETRGRSSAREDASAPGWSFAEIQRLVGRRYVSEERHPTLGIAIYNYTAKTQYEGYWNSETLACRGLILDERGGLVARPLGKFFNLGEDGAPPMPRGEAFEVFEKLDGSLIIATAWRGHLIVATRGSFVSPQARLAREMMEGRYGGAASAMREGSTYLFELIHPTNRIVVDYGAEEALYVLAVVDNASGRDLPLEANAPPGVPVVPSYPGYTDLSNLPERSGAEGYVVRFEGGLRYKVKHPEYVRVHRLASYATPKHVWEYLKEGRDPLDNLMGIPDEVYGVLRATTRGLRARYATVEASAKGLCESMERELGEGASRKEQAVWVRRQDRNLQPVLFAMLSGKDHSRPIWRMLEPKGDGRDGGEKEFPTG